MMKSNWVSPLVVACLLVLCACKQEQPAPVQYGVRVDVSKLESELANSGPEVQGHLASLKHALRYSQFSDAIGELDYLANRQDLSQTQKHLVDELVAQTTRELTNATLTPNQ
jgi:hypothetical protein